MPFTMTDASNSPDGLVMMVPIRKEISFPSFSSTALTIRAFMEAPVL